MELSLLDKVIDSLPEGSSWSLTEALPIYYALVDEGHRLPPLGWFFHDVQVRRKERGLA